MAACDGTIVEIEVYDGQPMVQKDDAVAQGMLLVSGVVDSKAGPILKRSRARIIAETQHDIIIRIPLEEAKPRTQRPYYQPAGFPVFGLSIPLYTDGPIEGEFIEEFENNPLTANGLRLPIGMATQRVYPAGNADHYPHSRTGCRRSGAAARTADRGTYRRGLFCNVIAHNKQIFVEHFQFTPVFLSLVSRNQVPFDLKVEGDPENVARAVRAIHGLLQLINRGEQLNEQNIRYVLMLVDEGMSNSASYSGRRYGSTFDCRSPGRKPSFSPASTAGRVRMIRLTSLAMRGRSLDDSFIILDEAQNTTSEQMKMFLTRLGWNSKMVVTGCSR